MSEKYFKDELRNDNVLSDAKNIVPTLSENKQRLEVSKIEKIISREIDAEIEKLETDADVYALLLTLDTMSLRLIFKACVESLGAACDENGLNRLNKNRVMALFFHVLGVYPEAVAPVNSGSDTGAEISVEDFAEVFPNFSAAAEQDFSAVAKLLPEEFRGVKSAEELQTALSEKIREGKIVRDFVEQTLKTAGVSFDSTKFTALRREEYLPLFFRAVKFVNFQTQKTAAAAAPVETEIVNITFGQMQAIFDAALKVPDEDFDIADTLKLFENNPVTVKDKFYLSVPDDKQIFRGVVAIATLEGEIAALGHVEDGAIIERGAERILPHLIFDSKMILQDKFRNRKTFLAVLFPQTAKDFFARPMSQSLAESYSGTLWTLEFNVNYSALAVTDRPLCIDFGTSNTTAGTYDLNKDGAPELVTFRDVTCDEIVFREVLPTIVYVESCRNGAVTFKHGYEAKREIINASYNTKSTVFYEIKRWVNSLDVVEEVTDGREVARITRREILRDYLLYVIRTAEQQYQVEFQNLHLSAPVKLREKFLAEMEKIFAGEYKVYKNSLDEGLATVYHYIARHVQTNDNTSGKILVLDSGGGTTDLASCEFSIEHGEDWPVLRLETDFESCDSNFGGNNITYRILQMLKMKIAANLERNENLQMYDLVPDDEDYILSQIDFDYANREKIYEAFEREYARVEDFIPTKFAEYTMKNERLKVKRNYYYLWQLAEAIKIEFFKSNLVNVDFEKDKRIFVRSAEEYYLSVRQEGKLQTKSDPMDGVEITIREINRVLLPDLYALLKTLLHHYTDGELTQYKYRLSGQSCKINKFRDLLKEFVPGKLMRVPNQRSNNQQASDSVALKKYCILGSIEYVRDARALGKYKAIIEKNRVDRRIYEIRSVVDSDEKILLGRSGAMGLKKFPKETGDAEFLVRGENNRVERRIHYHFDKQGAASPHTLAEILEIMAKESTHTLENLRAEIGGILHEIELQSYDGKIQPIFCLAALDSKSGYGFNVYQIWVNLGNSGAMEYWLPKKRPFESYEDENLQTFFNGDK